MTGKAKHLLDLTPRATRASRVRARARQKSLVALLATAALLPVVAAMPADAAAADRDGATSWASVFDSLRPIPAQDTRRVVVTFDSPSLGEWAAAGHTGLTEGQQQRFLKRAEAEQNSLLEQVGDAGVQFELQHRYLRVLNGVSLVVHGDNAQSIRAVHGVKSVTAVRTVYPAAAEEGAAAAGAAVAHDAATGAARPTIAVLDTGIDFNHPDLAGSQAGPGYDVTARETGVEPSGDDDHGTQVASVALSGAGGRAGLLPVRVLERQPVLGGAEAVVGSSDALLAGLEYAVDPNGDGSVADHASVALTALSEPYAGIAGSPEELAVAGAGALGTLTVAAAGNDGASGDAVGTVGGPAAADDALAVGAADLRDTAPTAVVHARGGLLDESFAKAPLLTQDTDVPGGDLPLVVISGSGADVVDYLGDDARSRVGGAVALVRQVDGVTLSAQVRAAADAGAAAVLIAGANSGELAGVLDERGLDIPAFGISTSAAATLTDASASAVIDLEFDLDSSAANPAAGSIAGFSSRGPRYDGAGKPDVVAPGVSVSAASPGVDANGDGRHVHVSGTSIAAAHAAGVAASLRAAHPDWSPARVRSALIGTGTLLGPGDDRENIEAQGGGLVSATRAAGLTTFATPARVDFGAVPPGTTTRTPVGFSHADGTAVGLPKLSAERSGDHKLLPSVDTDGFLSISVPDGTPSGVYGGWLVDERDGLRLPWSVAVRQESEFDVPLTLSLNDASFRPARGPGQFPAKLSLAIGGGGFRGSLGLRAAQKVDLRLLDAKGEVLGPLGALDHVLPGVYEMGLTGLDSHGLELAPGNYTITTRYVSAAEPGATWSAGPTIAFRIEK